MLNATYPFSASVKATFGPVVPVLLACNETAAVNRYDSGSHIIIVIGKIYVPHQGNSSHRAEIHVPLDLNFAEAMN